MRSVSKKSGFTFLEILIAMGILVTFLAVMGGLVGVAGRLLSESKADLQQAYAEKAVFELVSGSQVEDLLSSFIIDSLRIEDSEWLKYESGSDEVWWQAEVHVTEEGEAKKVEVELVSK